ncbi:MAG: hypothetical protein ACN2B6_00180 [Rickettsiales bacterium]
MPLLNSLIQAINTLALSLSDYRTQQGCKFNFEQVFTLSTGTPLYIAVENPAESGVDLELIRRFFQTDTGGADAAVLWDYDISTATKTPLAVFNENNNHRSDIETSIEVSCLNPITIDAGTGIASIDGAATVIDDGVIREPSFITSSGAGSNQSGDINPRTGSRIYKPGTGFLLKITSRDNNNNTLAGYTFSERKL